MRVAVILKTIKTNEIFDLSHLSALQLVGARAGEFLQGQITCDLREVRADKMQPAAFCGVNGRVLALLDVIDWNGLHLILPDNLCAPTESSLSKAAVFSQVQIIKSEKWRVFGLKLNLPESSLPLDIELPLEKHGMVHGAEYGCYHLHDDFYILLVNLDIVDQTLAGFARSSWRVCSALSWHDLQIQAQRANIYPESRGMFFPHRIGLQHTDHISFNKGCYRGQEIIARMHYRAQLKHEVRVLTMECADKIAVCDVIISQSSHEKIGEIIDYCQLDQDKYRLLISVLIHHTGDVYLTKP